MHRFTFSAILTLFIFLGATWLLTPRVAHSADRPPVVWKASKTVWIRDPNIFRTGSGQYILAGTPKTIIEFPSLNPSVFSHGNGTPYVLSILSPDGKRRIRKSGLHEWQKSFLRGKDGLLMIASLPTLQNYNLQRVSKAKRRSVFVFVPVANGRKTRSGFPLDWRMKSNKPFLRAIYNGDLFEDGNRGLYLHTDVRQDKGLKTTCLLAQTMDRSLKLGKPRVLLCPGQAVSRSVDVTGWDRDHPFPSEVRHRDGGGLLEGAWAYRASPQRYYILYSSGDYNNETLYGGFVALCSSPMGPCVKTLNAGKTDSRPFLQGSSRHYKRVGRPYPVVDQNGRLTDIIFHARRRNAKKDDILRCTNFSPDMLSRFVAGGPGCEYDDIRY
jgi:hypothetical protein